MEEIDGSSNGYDECDFISDFCANMTLPTEHLDEDKAAVLKNNSQAEVSAANGKKEADEESGKETKSSTSYNDHTAVYTNDVQDNNMTGKTLTSVRSNSSSLRENTKQEVPSIHKSASQDGIKADKIIEISSPCKLASRHGLRIPIKKRYFSIPRNNDEDTPITDIEDVSTDNELLLSARRGKVNKIKSGTLGRRGKMSMIRVKRHYIEHESFGGILTTVFNSEPAFLPPEDSNQVVKTKITMSDANDLLKTINEHSDLRDKPTNRYILTGDKKPPINIGDVISFEDLKMRTIFDNVLYREQHSGRFVPCWVRVVHGTVTCYDGTRIKETPGGSDEVFRNKKTGDCHPKKASFDIVQSRMLLPSPNQKESSFFSCNVALLDTKGLIDISTVCIWRVRPVRSGYAVDVTIEDGDRTYIIPGLDMIFEFNGYYHYFRVKSVADFLKWVLAYRFRKKRGICKL